MKKPILTIIFGGSVVLALTGIAGQALAQTPTEKVSRPALTVAGVKPKLIDIPIKLSANGSIAAWQEAIISADVSGLRLLDIKAQVGDQVKKGQILAVFDDEQVLADVEQSRAALAEAEANLADAKVNADRARGVVSSGAISAQQINQFFTTAKTAAAKVQSAKAHLDNQLLKLKHTRLLANDDGVISARNATLGTVPGVGEELFRLLRQNRLEWRAEVTAAELLQLQPGQLVNLEVPGAPKVVGKIRALAPALDQRSRNALVYVDVPDAYRNGLRPGMFARGEIGLGAKSGLMVPLDAISLRDGFSFAYRIEQLDGEHAKVRQLKVQLGNTVGELVEILGGLNADDLLVASGAAFLADGDNVRVVSK